MIIEPDLRFKRVIHSGDCIVFLVLTTTGAWRENLHIIYDDHEADAAIRRVAVSASRSLLSTDADIGL